MIQKLIHNWSKIWLVRERVILRKLCSYQSKTTHSEVQSFQNSMQNRSKIDAKSMLEKVVPKWCHSDSRYRMGSRPGQILMFLNHMGSLGGSVSSHQGTCWKSDWAWNLWRIVAKTSKCQHSHEEQVIRANITPSVPNFKIKICISKRSNTFLICLVCEATCWLPFVSWILST